MNTLFSLFKRTQLIVMAFIFSFQSYAQVEDFNIQRSVIQFNSENAYSILRHAKSMETIGNKTYIQGVIYGDEFLTGSIDESGKLTQNDVNKVFLKGKQFVDYFPVGEKLLLVWAKKDKKVYQIWACYYDPILNIFGKEQILLNEQRKNVFTYNVDFHNDQLYLFSFSEPSKDEKSLFNYVIADKNLSTKKIFNGVVPFAVRRYYKEQGSFESSYFFRDLYFDSKDRVYIYYMRKQDGKIVGELKRFSATGEYSEIKINTGGKFLNDIFIKDVNGKSILVGYTNYDKRPVVKEMHVYCMDSTDKCFVPVKSQSLDLFTADDEKINQYMIDFNPGRNLITPHYEFVTKDIHNTADGGYLIVGRGHTVCEAAGYIVGAPGNQTLVAGPAQPGFFCVKLDENFTKQWAQEFSTQYYENNSNSISISKNDEVFVAVNYHKGYYKQWSSNAMFIPDGFNLYKMSRDGHLSFTTIEKAVDELECYIKTESSFMVLLRAKKNKESKNTFYDTDNEFILYKIDKK